MAVALPPSPTSPPQVGGGGPGAGIAPAAPRQADRGGKEARGKVVAGLGLEMLRIAIPLLGNTPLGLDVANVVSKLGKSIAKPAQDIGQSEMTFMQQQLYPGGPGGAGPGPGGPGPGGPPPMPPTPAAPPMGAGGA